MKFRNLKVKDENLKHSGIIDYKSIAQVCLNSKVDGMTVDEMRQRFKVLDKIESLKENEVAELEQLEYDTLLTATRSTKWIISARDIIEFEDSLSKQ